MLSTDPLVLSQLLGMIVCNNLTVFQQPLPIIAIPLAKELSIGVITTLRNDRLQQLTVFSTAPSHIIAIPLVKELFQKITY